MTFVEMISSLEGYNFVTSFGSENEVSFVSFDSGLFEIRDFRKRDNYRIIEIVSVISEPGTEDEGYSRDNIGFSSDEFYS